MAKTTVISGVGAGLGASLVRKFARAGHRVGMLARSPGYIQDLEGKLKRENLSALAVPTDITDPDQVKRGFESVREQLGPVDTLINHAGNAAWGDFEGLTAERFEQSWRVCAWGAFLCCKEALPDMLAGGEGAMLFTGATSSIRGRGGASAFSSAKFAVRGLAEALARELWPKGIHVAHVVIDGVLDTPALREGGGAEGPLLDTDAVAQAYWDLARQERGAWTLEIDVRPNEEDFFV